MNDYLLFIIPTIVFIGGFLSTVAGMGGGLVIIAACSLVLPIGVIVPMSGVFVLAGQVARTAQFYRHIAWQVTAPFIPGSILGAFLGTMIYFSLSETAIALMLGCVMLWFSWVPRTRTSQRIAEYIPLPYLWVGIIHTFLSTVSGAGGLLQSLMVNSSLNKESIVATIAATLLAMSVFKTVGYYLAGFDYLAWAPVIILSWISGVAGTAAGKYSLNRMPDIFFRRLIKAMVTLFALRLLWRAVSGLWA